MQIFLLAGRAQRVLSYSNQHSTLFHHQYKMRGASLMAASAAISATSASSPTCAINGTACPPPTWTPTWNLTLSTVCQPGGTASYFLPAAEQPWGLVSLDWSVAEGIWNHANKSTSTCEATSIRGCQLIKQSSPGTRCFIYHNMELALEWLETQRRVMYDPTKADWFIQYTDGHGNKNGTIYNEPRGEGDQFFWDFRVPDAANYYIESVVASVTADPAVDGTFTDDVTGLPAEHPEAPAHTKMTAAEVAELQQATQATSAALIDALVAKGKYNWQAFGAGDAVNGGVSKSNCVSWMRSYCQPAMQANPMFVGFDPSNANQSIAGFLVARPLYAYIGFGWESDERDWNPIFATQVGEPQSLCVEAPTGVFSREWTYGNVTLDCNSWTATIPSA